MNLSRITYIFVNILLVISLCCCVRDEIVLHGDISGYVTDAVSNEPIHSASVQVKRNNMVTDTLTDDQGRYLLKNLIPAVYEIEVSKQIYNNVIRYTEVNSANTTEIDFAISKLPYPDISVSSLDFGFQSTSMSFTISNAGAANFSYSLASSQEWITITPLSGNIATETDTIRVTIHKTGLSEYKLEEVITVISQLGERTQYDEVAVYANGVLDQDGKHYYDIVTIGTQTWMAENLNGGTMIGPGNTVLPADNGIVEKNCYEDDEINCDIYGGLYERDEMLDYPTANEGNIDIIQGVCPSGWHVSTQEDWQTLFNFLGGQEGAGGKLKSTGDLKEGTGLWEHVNVGASNEVGFNGLPGSGMNLDLIYQSSAYYHAIGEMATFWMVGTNEQDYLTALWQNHAEVEFYPRLPLFRCSVRCVKDP